MSQNAGEAEWANVTEGRESEEPRSDQGVTAQRPDRITQVHAFVLEKGAEGVLQADVRKALGIRHSHVFEIATKLEERGLIDRVRLPRGVRLIPRSPSSPAVAAVLQSLSSTSSAPSAKPIQHRSDRRPKSSWTYAQSTSSIECAPCLTCPLEARCSITDDPNPLTCSMLAQWVVREKGAPHVSLDSSQLAQVDTMPLQSAL